MRAKSFLNVSLGILALALAYHLGARSATAQAPGNPVVAVWNGPAVVTANGDVYYNTASTFTGPWTYQGNVFTGATPAQQGSFGGLKARYRGER